MNLMPFFEIKFLREFGPDEFDIFKNSTEIKEQLKQNGANPSTWDYILNIDYEKLKKYIQF